VPVGSKQGRESLRAEPDEVVGLVVPQDIYCRSQPISRSPAGRRHESEGIAGRQRDEDAPSEGIANGSLMPFAYSPSRLLCGSAGAGVPWPFASSEKLVNTPGECSTGGGSSSDHQACRELGSRPLAASSSTPTVAPPAPPTPAPALVRATSATLSRVEESVGVFLCLIIIPVYCSLYSSNHGLIARKKYHFCAG